MNQGQNQCHVLVADLGAIAKVKKTQILRPNPTKSTQHVLARALPFVVPIEGQGAKQAERFAHRSLEASRDHAGKAQVPIRQSALFTCVREKEIP